MHNFDFLGKGLGIVSLPYFVYDFSKIFVMLYSINWSYFIVGLDLVLKISVNMCIITIVC